MPDYLWFLIGLAAGAFGVVLALGISGSRNRFSESDLFASYNEGYTDRGDIEPLKPK